MTNADRQQARLKLKTLIRELPLGADLCLSVRGLTRAEYDDLPGSNEVTVGRGRGTVWTKDLEAPGVLVEFWTEEKPAAPISWPFTRKPDLRVVGECEICGAEAQGADLCALCARHPAIRYGEDA